MRAVSKIIHKVHFAVTKPSIPASLVSFTLKLVDSGLQGTTNYAPTKAQGGKVNTAH
jgi:hypothetical protein